MRFISLGNVLDGLASSAAKPSNQLEEAMATLLSEDGEGRLRANQLEVGLARLVVADYFSTAAGELYNALVGAGAAAPRWMERAEGRGVPLFSDPASVDGLEILIHAAKHSARAHRDWDRHGAEVLAAGRDLEKEPQGRDLSRGLYPRTMEVRAMYEIGFEAIAIERFLLERGFSFSQHREGNEGDQRSETFDAAPPPQRRESGPKGIGPKRWEQVCVIVEIIQKLGYDPLKIPNGGKSAARARCKADRADLFGGGDSPFNDAWKAAGPNRLKMADRDVYAGDRAGGQAGT